MLSSFRAWIAFGYLVIQCVGLESMSNQWKTEKKLKSITDSVVRKRQTGTEATSDMGSTK